MCFALIMILTITSGHNVACCETSFELLWHVQNCDLIGSIFREQEQYVGWQNLDKRTYKVYANCFKGSKFIWEGHHLVPGMTNSINTNFPFTFRVSMSETSIYTRSSKKMMAAIITYIYAQHIYGNCVLHEHSDNMSKIKMTCKQSSQSILLKVTHCGSYMTPSHYKHGTLWLIWFLWFNQVKILHMSWQLSCHDMCKIMTWND